MSRTCDDCGESFGTLTALRVHERDECSARETYGEVDPDAPDAAEQGVEQALTCRDCGQQNPGSDRQRTSWADGDLHLIYEFECRFCGFENENRLVMQGVEKSDLGKLPPHLQPDESEVGQ